MEKVFKNLKGFLFAIIIYFILTLVAGVLIKLTPIPEAWSIYYVMIALCIACTFLGIYAGCCTKKRGFLYGALYSIVLILIIIIFNMMAFSTGIETDISILKYFVCVLFGSIGGMIGVNMRL